MEVELRADEPFVRIGLDFDNRSDDHRVRFASPCPSRPRGRTPRANLPSSSAACPPKAATARSRWRLSGPRLGGRGRGGGPARPPHRVRADRPRSGAGVHGASLDRADQPHQPVPPGPGGSRDAVPDAQLRGPRRLASACSSTRKTGSPAGRRCGRALPHGTLVAWPGLGDAGSTWPPEGAGADALPPRRSEQVVLSSLRRRDDGWLEARIVNLAGDARGRGAERRDPRGERGPPTCAASPGPTLPLGPDGTPRHPSRACRDQHIPGTTPWP